MKYFTTVHDVKNANALVQDALRIKKNPHACSKMGRNKTLGLIFLNPSLRTRLSTQKAAHNLGMNVIVMNLDKESWSLEFEDGAIMNGTKVEHIRDAAGVLSSYCDIIGLRSFPSLSDRAQDYGEKVLLQFMKYAKVPFISLESATRHPLQSLADAMTIREKQKTKRPKVVLTWAPHIKPLPQAVPNSFAEWMHAIGADLTITHPEGYELHEDYVKNAAVTHNQQEALEQADFVYVKNWSAYEPYGQILNGGHDWLLTQEKMRVTNNAHIMHCLPVRRNLELSDELLDSDASLVQLQALNRVYAAQAVLKNILESNYQVESVSKTSNELTES
jgi:N-succinyl-L-ornithine transcarbamylase